VYNPLGDNKSLSRGESDGAIFQVHQKFSVEAEKELVVIVVLVQV